MSKNFPVKIPMDKRPMEVGGSEAFSKKRFAEAIKHWSTEFVEGRLHLCSFLDNLEDDASAFCYQTGRAEEVSELEAPVASGEEGDMEEEYDNTD